MAKKPSRQRSKRQTNRELLSNLRLPPEIQAFHELKPLIAALRPNVNFNQLKRSLNLFLAVKAYCNERCCTIVEFTAFVSLFHHNIEEDECGFTKILEKYDALQRRKRAI